MEQHMILWHGSQLKIEKPVFGMGKIHNDFGLGFYCTESEDLAKEWACSSLHGGYANRYSIDTTDMHILRLNSEEYSILNWIAVLVEHRTFRITNPLAGRAKKYLQEHFYINVNAYDIIIGYRADDSYFDFAEAFLNNTLSVSQLDRAMRLGKLGEQVVIKSRWAFDSLHYEGYSDADPMIHYKRRKERNEDAEAMYQEMADETDDGLYMLDIIRGKVTNDDPRIPRILPK